MGRDVTRDALEWGSAQLLRKQCATGAWRVSCHAGPASTAHVTVALHFIGKLDASEARAAGRFLEAEWRGPGGGFESYPGADAGDLGATAAAWAALHACGYDAAHPILVDARRLVAELGGEAALLQRFREGDLAALFLAMVGLFPADLLPLPPSALYVPGAEHAIESRLNVILPFTSFAVGAIVKRLRARPRTNSRRTWAGQLADLTARLEAKRTLAQFRRFHNADGSWLYGDTYHASLVLAAMSALDLDDADGDFYGGLRFLKDMRRSAGDQQRCYPMFETDVWPTAFTVRALLEAGASASDASISRALAWLCDCQRRGAWAFQAHNTTMPDCDDAGVAIAALARALEPGSGALPAELEARVRSAVQEGRAWLRSRQNRDGGWASFQLDLPSKARGPMFTSATAPSQDAWSQLMLLRDPAPELGDPATEDVTARVLFGLGRSGSTVGESSVDRALVFLEHQQDTNGGWWGRWTINYLAGTAWVVRGLVAVAADLQAPWVKRGLRFLVERQNGDGGWGEDAASYRDLDQIGRGRSTPGLTGLVTCALLEAGTPPGSSAIEGARRYLLGVQTADGSWPRNGELHALLPPRLFYELPDTENQLPLEALGLFHRLEAQRSARPAKARTRWSEQLLQEMYATTDAAADAVATELVAAGELKQVNRLFRVLQQAGDPLPADLPAPAREYFASTAALPGWADQAKLRLAHGLFVRCGFAVATSLLCSSLPQCFAFPDGAKALASTSSFQRGAERRLLETAQFVFDVAARQGFSPDGRAIRAAQKVRLMHAAVRVHLTKQGWNAATNGPPINQRQLVGTMLTFSLVVTDALRGLGFDVHDDEVDAWFHLWRVTGALLGISEQYLPATAAEGEQLMRVLRQRFWGPSAEGTALTRATLAIMQTALPGLRWTEFPAALVRHLAGDACADLLELPRAAWSRRLVEGGALLLGNAVPRGFGRTGLVTTAQQISFALMRALGELNIGDSPVTFNVPEELLRNWQASL